MNKNRFTIYIVLLVLILMLTGNTSLSASKYKTLTKKQIAELINSPDRFVVNLAGKWQISADDENWQTAFLPGVPLNGDKIYLKRTIRIDKKVVNRFAWELYFLGVDENIEIYLNNQFVGKYLGAMTPFSVQLPKRFLLRQL